MIASCFKEDIQKLKPKLKAFKEPDDPHFDLSTTIDYIILYA